MIWVSSTALLELNLPNLPKTVRGINKKAVAQGWIFRKREGRGGGKEFLLSSLPAAVRSSFKHFETPAVASSAVSKELEVAQARAVVVDFVLAKKEQLGTLKAAIEFFSVASRNGGLPLEIANFCELAKAKTSASSQKGIGMRVLAQWCSKKMKNRNLAPARSGQPIKKLGERDWLPDFLDIYKQNYASINQVYLLFSYKYKEINKKPPSIHTVRRVFNALPEFIREKGRMSESSLKRLKTFSRRDWNTNLVLNDVWIGDGHSMKMKVAHPVHGQPFTPELTLIIDGASRMIVGWSLSYSENVIAITNAFKSAVEKFGLPVIYYSDNGGGQKNKTLDKDMTGVFARLGVEHRTGIAGNPQARGIIERVMKTVANRISQQFKTYYGRGTDPFLNKRMLYSIQSLAKAERDCKQLTQLQKSAIGKLPSWRDLLNAIPACIDYYNNTHIHRSIQMPPAKMRELLLMKHHGTEKGASQEIFLSQEELRLLPLPSFNRVCQRGYISFNKMLYWHKDLELYDKKRLSFLVDQHHSDFISVYTTDGDFICDAKLDGNTRDAFVITEEDRLKRRRLKGRLKRAQEKIDEARAEYRGLIEPEYSVIESEYKLSDEKELLPVNDSSDDDFLNLLAVGVDADAHQDGQDFYMFECDKPVSEQEHWGRSAAKKTSKTRRHK